MTPIVPTTVIERAETTANKISIEATQPRSDLNVLRDLATKTVMFGVIDLRDSTIEAPEPMAGRIAASCCRSSRLQHLIAG